VLEAPPFEPAGARPNGRRGPIRLAVGAALLALAALGVMPFVIAPGTRARPAGDLAFTPLTNLPESAVAPAISPDGRMVAFFGGIRPFLNTDPIYLKKLPDGEAIPLTRDPRPKYGIVFSPDGSQIAYSAVTNKGWATLSIPVAGGEPALLVGNAAGLTWLDRERLLFSAVKTGLHMGIVSSRPDRSDPRELYFPAHERSMAHYSYASPDRRWALVVEMDHRPVWQACRLIPLDGSAQVRTVGPDGQCTSAGWSRDGRWMYFSVEVDQQFHLWRQRFPDGRPEQLTFGPTEEEGVAVAPDGSLVTSIGMHQSAIWVRDSRGERPLSSEGQITGPGGFSGLYWLPRFSSDGRSLTYLRRESTTSSTGLWRTEIASGQSERLLPGVAMHEYDVNRAETEVVFTVQVAGKPSEIRTAPLDGSAPPRAIASSGENSPHFGPAGEILFRFTDGKANYLGRIDADGSGRRKVVEYAIGTVQTISPDRRWLVAITPRFGGAQGAASIATSTGGGPPRRLCASVCRHAWSPDGRFIYVELERKSRTSPGRTMVLPVLPDTGLPDLPEAGIDPASPPLQIRGSRIVELTEIAPGLDPDTYAYVKENVQRNLFRIPALPD
jgi:Tol biopolymer transport system component